jgi:PPOX class probable F420-dependent enzyme
MQTMEQFRKSKYLNIETFRRNGVGVKTPVWFVQDGDMLYVKTGSNSGKVKRLRCFEGVNVVPCKVDGKSTGTWLSGKGVIVNDDAIEKNVQKLYDKKYGLLGKLFFNSQTRKGLIPCVLEITPVDKD